MCVCDVLLLSTCRLRNTGRTPEKHSCANGSCTTLFVCTGWLVQRKSNSSLKVHCDDLKKGMENLICQSERKKIYLTPVNTFSFSHKCPLPRLDRLSTVSYRVYRDPVTLIILYQFLWMYSIIQYMRFCNTCSVSLEISKPHNRLFSKTFHFKQNRCKRPAG